MKIIRQWGNDKCRRLERTRRLLHRRESRCHRLHALQSSWKITRLKAAYSKEYLAFEAESPEERRVQLAFRLPGLPFLPLWASWSRLRCAVADRRHSSKWSCLHEAKPARECASPLRLSTSFRAWPWCADAPRILRARDSCACRMPWSSRWRYVHLAKRSWRGDWAGS